MSTSSITKSWESKRTSQTREVETLLKNRFEQADAYRYNSASIRVRVIDPSFEGMSREQRDTLVEEQLDKLPPEIQRDIVNLLTLAPSELSSNAKSLRVLMLNSEFEDPSPSVL